jgi:hypothetical protein
VNASGGGWWSWLTRRRWDTPGELDGPLCAAKRPLTRAEADQAVVRSIGLSEAYECPTGLGWHLRVTKDEGQD